MSFVILIRINFFIVFIICLLSSCYANDLNRQRRQAAEEESVDDESKSLICDFGAGMLLQFCTWTVDKYAHPQVKWRTGSGTQAYWLGGPLDDHTQMDALGGYAYFETSYKMINQIFTTASLESGYDKNALIKSESFDNRGDTKAANDDEDGDQNNERFNQTNFVKETFLQVKPIDLTHIPDSAALFSPNVSKSGPQGFCISFFYNIDGLSADRLRLLVKDTNSGVNQTLWESKRSSFGKWVKAEVSYSYNQVHQIVLEAIARNWKEAERVYRGYIAVDDVQIQPKGESDSACHGQCTFDGGFCGWTNEEEKDDFDWKLGRGSDNFFTGPGRDYYSFNKEFAVGGYAFIDGSFPRRPGDRAVLISPQFEATGEKGPVCFTFATHMYGNGIGTLRIKQKSTEKDEKEEEAKEKLLWEMSGEAGNSWYLGQFTIASLSPYNIIIEGEIGINYLSNIAIDTLSIEQGSCPVTPQAASKKSGDCSFEENMCFWTNPQPYSNLDDFDWVRRFSYGSVGPKFDHTKKTSTGYFLSLNGDSIQPQRGGSRAWIISPEFTSSPGVGLKCLSFYYFMYQRLIEPSGPSLGGLRVHIRTTNQYGEVVLYTIWRLNNHQSMTWKPAQVTLSISRGEEITPPPNSFQVVIEGIWGDARVGSIAIDDISFFDGACPTHPTMAATVSNECFFDGNLCGYRNDTRPLISGRESTLSVSFDRLPFKPIGRDGGESLSWRMATMSGRPANLADHTFAAPIGYVFFDVFNRNHLQKPSLHSPKMPGSETIPKMCVSFWFSGFGRGETTTLNVYQLIDKEVEGEKKEEKEKDKEKGEKSGENTKVLLWSIQTRQFNFRRPSWRYGQAPLASEVAFEIVFEGEATDGGFALDDITFYNGTCQTRPIDATVIRKTEPE